MTAHLASVAAAAVATTQAAGHDVGSAQAVAWMHRGDVSLWTQGQTAGPAWSHAPVTVDTRFDVASLTKPMVTVTLLAQALSQGRLTVGQRLESFVPDARGTVLGAATVGQLLSHTSGAPAWVDFFTATQALPPQERQVAARALVLNTPLQHRPGEVAVYSDLGFLALGWLLEALHAQPLDALYAAQIAEPLGLRARYQRLSAPLADRTDVVATEEWAPRDPTSPLRGVVHDDNAVTQDGVAGHAGLFASVADVAAWAQIWLQAVRSTAQTPHGPLGIHPDVARWLTQTAGCPSTTWRHGWDTPSRPTSSAGRLVPRDAFGHLGFTGTSVWIAPRAQAIAVLLTNRVHPTRASVAGIRTLRPLLHDALWSACRTAPLRQTR